MIRAMIAHANTAILRSQFSVTVRRGAVSPRRAEKLEEKLEEVKAAAAKEKEKAQQQIGCAAISLGPAPAQTRVDALPHDFSPRLPHDLCGWLCAPAGS